MLSIELNIFLVWFYAYLVLYALVIVNFMLILINYLHIDNAPLALLKNFTRPIFITFYIIQFLALGGLPPFGLFWLKLIILNKLFITSHMYIYIYFSVYLLGLLYFYIKYLQLMIPISIINKKTSTNSAMYTYGEITKSYLLYKIVYINTLGVFNMFLYYNDFILLFRCLIY